MRYRVLLASFAAVATMIATNASGAAEPSGASPTPVFSQNVEANRLFLAGRQYLERGDPRTGGSFDNARQAIRYFQQAIDKDPSFALAYVDMARAWLRLGYSNPGGADDDEIMPPTRAALAKAVALDPKLPDGHLMLAAVAYNLDFDWATADREYRLGLALQPNNGTAHASYGAYLTVMGRFPEALQQLNEAATLAPSATTDFAFARAYYAMRAYDKAADYCRTSLDKQDNLVVRFYLGLIYAAGGQYARAIPELEATTVEKNGGALAGLAYAYAMAGQKDRAISLLDKLFANHDSGLVVAYRVAAVYLALGDSDKAIEWLGKSYAAHENWLPNLKVDPVMDPLRSDPRFVELMRTLHFDDTSGRAATG